MPLTGCYGSSIRDYYRSVLHAMLLQQGGDGSRQDVGALFLEVHQCHKSSTKLCVPYLVVLGIRTPPCCSLLAGAAHCRNHYVLWPSLRVYVRMCVCMYVCAYVNIYCIYIYLFIYRAHIPPHQLSLVFRLLGFRAFADKGSDPSDPAIWSSAQPSICESQF